MRSNTAHICSHKGPIRSKTEHIKIKNEHYCAVLNTNIPNTNTWNIPWCWTQMFIYWTPTSKLEHIFWTLVVKRIHSIQNMLQFMCSNSEHLFLECSRSPYTKYYCVWTGRFFRLDLDKSSIVVWPCQSKPIETINLRINEHSAYTSLVYHFIIIIVP